MGLGFGMGFGILPPASHGRCRRNNRNARQRNCRDAARMTEAPRLEAERRARHTDPDEGSCSHPRRTAEEEASAASAPPHGSAPESRRGCLENAVFEPFDHVSGDRGFVGLLISHEVAEFIRVRNVYDIQSLPHESEPLCFLGRGQRQCTERSAVKRAEERDELLPPRVIHREFQGRFDRFGAAVSKVRLGRAVYRTNFI